MSVQSSTNYIQISIWTAFKTGLKICELQVTTFRLGIESYLQKLLSVWVVDMEIDDVLELTGLDQQSRVIGHRR